MKKSLRTVAFLLAALAGVAMAAPTGASTGEDVYVCPPCGAAHDRNLYDKPGACPECGMKLVPKSSLQGRYKVAILLFEGVQIIDYAGPYEVFGQGDVFDVFTVSEKGTKLTTAMGLDIIPAHSFENGPKPDILVVPGGDVRGPLGSARTIEWIRAVEKDARHVMSVCNGAFILAKAGLLDGKSATTFYAMIDDLRKAAPKTKVVNDQRWVDNGKVITTAGLSSGIDGSLHIISRIRGMARAKAVALHMEYDWDPGSDFARAALADLKFPDIDLPAGVEADLVATEGTRETWTRRYEIRGPLTAAQLTNHLRAELRTQPRWKPVEAKTASEGSSWTSLDEDGSTWKFTAGLREPGKDGDPRLVRLHIEKIRTAATGIR